MERIAVDLRGFFFGFSPSFTLILVSPLVFGLVFSLRLISFVDTCGYFYDFFISFVCCGIFLHFYIFTHLFFHLVCIWSGRSREVCKRGPSCCSETFESLFLF